MNSQITSSTEADQSRQPSQSIAKNGMGRIKRKCCVQERMERSQKILDLREKYYKKYNAFLTQKQIERVYELEHKAMKKLSKKGYRAPRGKGQRHGKPSRNRVDR